MLEILIYGAITSGIYAMLAIGFTLVFGVARMINLAHGAFFGMGAYLVYAFVRHAALPLAVCIVLAVIVVGAFGAALELWLIRPLREASLLGVLVVTLAISLLFEQAVYLLVGSEPQNVPALFDRAVQIRQVSISEQRLFVLGISIASISLLWSWIRFSKLGSAITAIAQDSVAARYVGIPSNKIYVLVMAISAALAAAAGAITSPFLSVQPTMDLLPMVKAFSIVIVGGLGSVPGSIVASFILGYGETIVAYLFSSAWTDLVSLLVVLTTLIIRPSGLFGKS